MTESQLADIKACLDVLRRGGVIVYPTDTIWGIGCDACCSEAVKKIFELKKRADAKALITLVGSEGQLERTVADIPDVAWQLIEYNEKPLTIVYDAPLREAGIAPELRAQDGSIGVRLTSDEFCAELCKRLRRPLVSTSANVSGEPAPACFDDISKEIIDGADYVCMSRRDEKPAEAAPSTVMRLSSGGLFKVLRP
ncbi:MAG: Sua5/YciO/YrdC/YwlC family protein [Muribaculaceae bacterium]|nr:Sua5/YciO/YrdC/YwlC family protein [Muribaculaceae bacterium]